MSEALHDNLTARIEEANQAFFEGRFDEARTAFEALAAQSHPPAFFFSGFLYLRGLGIPQDVSRPYDFFLQGAELGEAGCQDMVGRFHLEGYLTRERRPEQAAPWFAKAAADGFPPAQAQLGVMQVQGYGVPVDRVSGYAWIHLAADQHVTLATSQRKILQHLLPAADLKQALELVKVRRRELPASPPWESPPETSNSRLLKMKALVVVALALAAASYSTTNHDLRILYLLVLLTFPYVMSRL